MTLFGETLLLVASDGAGSARHSDQGSRLACDTIASAVATYLNDGGLVSSLTEKMTDPWIDCAVRALHDRAAIIEQPVRELACTLIVALLGPNGSAYLQLGDGGIIGKYLDDYVSITWPSGGEYANTTFFLSDDRAVDHLQSVFGAPPIDEVAVFTDGLQMLALQFAAVRPHSPFFQPMFHRLRSVTDMAAPSLQFALEAYLESTPINRRTDDDKTLMLAVRTPPVAQTLALRNLRESNGVDDGDPL